MVQERVLEILDFKEFSEDLGEYFSGIAITTSLYKWVLFSIFERVLFFSIWTSIPFRYLGQYYILCWVSAFLIFNSWYMLCDLIHVILLNTWFANTFLISYMLCEYLLVVIVSIVILGLACIIIYIHVLY